MKYDIAATTIRRSSGDKDETLLTMSVTIYDVLR